uniref:Saposin B-type domain-containing protein n=1 Tax=Plectus sambesii TaxID=2011161 RepID=A0A914XMD6_9BILA
MDFIRNILVCIVLYAVSSRAAPQSAFTRGQRITTEMAMTTVHDGESTDDVNGASSSPTPTEVISSTDSSSFTEATDGTETSTGGSLTGKLKCEACKLISGWMLSKAMSETTLQEWLNSKCENALFLASACKMLVSTQIQKFMTSNGQTNAQLCRVTINVC